MLNNLKQLKYTVTNTHIYTILFIRDLRDKKLVLFQQQQTHTTTTVNITRDILLSGIEKRCSCSFVFAYHLSGREVDDSAVSTSLRNTHHHHGSGSVGCFSLLMILPTVRYVITITQTLIAPAFQ